MFALVGAMLLSGARLATASCESCRMAGGSSGEFLLSLAEGKQQPALLLDTRIAGEINGMLASITVEQSFSNQHQAWVNGRYVFPLPDGAAVDSLEIHIGERVIKGEIKEKAEARKTFERAKREGKKAVLLEQHRPNLFSVSVANIGPGEKLSTRLRYVDKVLYRDDTFSLRLPTTLTPRYVAGAPRMISGSLQRGDNHATHHPRSEPGDSKSLHARSVAINPQHGWAGNTDSVPDAADITPPQTHTAPAQTSHRFELQLKLDAGLALANVHSPSHVIHNQMRSSRESDITLANGNELLDRDLILQWQAGVGAESEAAVFQQRIDSADGSEFYNMLMVMPPKANSLQSLPRDVTFIIDSSGSMAGASMQQAKQALQRALGYLGSNDRFNIIDFDSDFHYLFASPQAVNGNNLALANAMISRLDAEGGTEMLGALRFALAQPADEQWLRQIIFITDGSIGNEQELYSLIDRQLGNARLFTIGIGTAPNAWFMRKAAKFGRGSYTLISQPHEVQRKLADLFASINQPMLKNIRLNWSGQVEHYPEVIPDLYAGQPIVVVARSEHPIGTIELAGEMAGQRWRQRLDVAPLAPDSLGNARNLDTLWARQKVETLMDQLLLGNSPLDSLKPEIVRLGLKHRLLTRFTSFVAVEQRISKPESARSKHDNVPNLMPAGSAMPAPQTATSAWQKMLMGLFLMLLAAGLSGNRIVSRKAQYTGVQ